MVQMNPFSGQNRDAGQGTTAAREEGEGGKWRDQGFPHTHTTCVTHIEGTCSVAQGAQSCSVMT